MVGDDELAGAGDHSPTPELSAGLDDPHRLAVLAETGLLDSPADDTFDRFTRLVTRILDVPVSQANFVDDRRQFAKSVCAPGPPWTDEREAPLTHSFCRLVVTEDAPLIVSDSRTDPRVADNGAIANGVVAYAGIPLRTPDGVPLGSLCAVDTVPRDWTDDDLAALTDLANAASSEISLRLAAVRQRAFSANASHQLRTPLTALRLQLEELGFDADDPATVRGSIDQLVGEVDRLTDTVATLLQMAREGRFGHERRVELGALVEGVATRWQRLARSRDRRVEAQVHTEVHELVPVAALTQIVEVLVENALDHGEGTVTIELDGAGDHTRLCVRDEGGGLSDEAAARIFERDERGEGSAGEGIGLSLADEIARRVGGRLVLLPGSPTTFELLLPRR